MTHDVTPIKIIRSASGDESGTPLATEKGFFNYGEKRSFDREGEQVVGTALLFLKDDSNFDPTLDIEWKFKDVKNDETLRLGAWHVIDDPRTGVTHHYEIELI